MVAYQLIKLVGRSSAAEILGITFRELDRLVEIFELSERFRGLKEFGASITWARELIGLSKNLRTPGVIDAVVEKVAQKRITNSKDLRKLRSILPDEHFLSEEGDLESAMLRLGGTPKAVNGGFSSDLDMVVESMKRLPWTALTELRKDPQILKKIDEATSLLKSFRDALSQ